MTKTELRRAINDADLKCARLAAFGTDEQWNAAKAEYDRLAAAS